MPTDDSATEKPSRRQRLMRPLLWMLTTSDEIVIGPRVPARVRAAWGVLVIVLLMWLIVLSHIQVAQNSELIETLTKLR